MVVCSGLYVFISICLVAVRCFFNAFVQNSKSNNLQISPIIRNIVILLKIKNWEKLELP